MTDASTQHEKMKNSVHILYFGERIEKSTYNIGYAPRNQPVEGLNPVCCREGFKQWI